MKLGGSDTDGTRRVNVVNVSRFPQVSPGFHIPVPTGPGLGIKVNEEAMRNLCRQGGFFTGPTTYWDSQVGGEKAYT